MRRQPSRKPLPSNVPRSQLAAVSVSLPDEAEIVAKVSAFLDKAGDDFQCGTTALIERFWPHVADRGALSRLLAKLAMSDLLQYATKDPVGRPGTGPHKGKPVFPLIWHFPIIDRLVPVSKPAEPKPAGGLAELQAQVAALTAMVAKLTNGGGQ